MFLGCAGVGRKRTLVQRDLISAQIAEQTSLINPRSFADLPLPANLTRVSIRNRVLPFVSHAVIVTGIPTTACKLLQRYLFISIHRFDQSIFHRFIPSSVSKPVQFFLRFSGKSIRGRRASRRHAYVRWNFTAVRNFCLETSSLEILENSRGDERDRETRLPPLTP